MQENVKILSPNLYFPIVHKFVFFFLSKGGWYPYRTYKAVRRACIKWADRMECITHGSSLCRTNKLMLSTFDVVLCFIKYPGLFLQQWRFFLSALCYLRILLCTDSKVINSIFLWVFTILYIRKLVHRYNDNGRPYIHCPARVYCGYMRQGYFHIHPVQAQC